MGWIALAGPSEALFAPAGLVSPPGRAPLVDTAPDGLMVRGSLVIETRLSPSRRPLPILRYERGGDWPFHLALHAIPGGGLTLVLDHGDGASHCALDHSEAGRTENLRITYAWDAPRRWARLAIERTDTDRVVLAPVPDPRPIRVEDIRRIAEEPGSRYLSPEVAFLGVSSRVEPVGPMPALTRSAQILTPRGYLPLAALQAGDTVLTPEGAQVPILACVTRTVPARGSFAPVRLRAPFFGLLQDSLVGPQQRLRLEGSEVEYMFGKEAVLARAGHLVGGTAAHRQRAGPLISYSQVLLPGCATLVMAGCPVESLFIGRLRRKPALLEASLLAGSDRRRLPDHGQAAYPVLKAFEAMVLSEQRAA